METGNGSAAIYRRVIDGNLDAIATCDLDGMLTYANAALARLLAVPTPEELVGTDARNWFLSPQTAIALEERVSRENGLRSHRTLVIARDGGEIPVEMSVMVFTDDEGTPAGYATIIRDIRERLLHEAQLRSLVEEKELLFREMNHRTKNNLALIEALINLREEGYDGPIDHGEILRQIGAVRTLHELLHRQAETNQISMDEYIPYLLEVIVASLPVNDIAWECTVDAIILDASTAVSVGLVVNELLTNAMKHSFTGDIERSFSVELRRDDNRTYCLTISNTGRPIPDHVSVETESNSGLGLVADLVEQLSGSIEIVDRVSSTFEVCFPVDRRSGIPRPVANDALGAIEE